MENVLDVLLQRFDAATQAAYVNVGGATVSILWMLAGIAVALSIVFNMFGGKTPWMALFSKFILIGFFAWLVEAWPAVVDQIQGTFIQVGNMAGGSTVDFSKPSAVSAHGSEVAGVFFKAAREVPFSLWDMGTWVNGFVAFFLAGWAIQLGYWVAAIMLAVSQVFFSVASIAALFMTAFMVFTGTAWMGRGALGTLVSRGLSLMMLAVILSISTPVFNAIAYDTADAYAANQAILSSLVMLVLVFGSNAIARSVGNGVASWGMGSALSTAGAAAVGVGAVAAGAAMVAGPAARAALGQMSASQAASAAGPKIAMNASSSYTTAGKIEDMSLKGRTASTSRPSFSASPEASSSGNAASGSQVSSRGIKQLQAARPAMPSAVSSILIARAAVPEIADEGASLQPSNVG